jgi:hypothetical protein
MSRKNNKYYYVVIAKGIFGLTYLASSCNSTVIETYGDMIRVSHGFDGCQMLEYIADSKGKVIADPALARL